MATNIDFSNCIYPWF